MDKNDFDELQKIVKSSGPKIEQSRIFLSLLSKNYIEDPITVLQVGIAVLLGKPIAVIAIDGTEIPDGLKKLAFHVSHAKDPMEASEQVKIALKKFEDGK